MPTVRQFSADEWKAYRDLRLRALRESPNAFGSTLELEQDRPDEEWAERLRSGVDSPWDIPLVAQHGGDLAGLVWGKIDPAAPDKAHVFQMWVAPESRGFGIATMLIDAVVEWARSANARVVVLSVTCGDTPARRLYARAGFQPVGDPGPVRAGSPMLSQPMRLELRDSGFGSRDDL
jgi:GNAT superfamily N-acetyltransferase